MGLPMRRPLRKKTPSAQKCPFKVYAVKTPARGWYGAGSGPRRIFTLDKHGVSAERYAWAWAELSTEWFNRVEAMSFKERGEFIQHLYGIVPRGSGRSAVDKLTWLFNQLASGSVEQFEEELKGRVASFGKVGQACSTASCGPVEAVLPETPPPKTSAGGSADSASTTNLDEATWANLHAQSKAIDLFSTPLPARKASTVPEALRTGEDVALACAIGLPSALLLP